MITAITRNEPKPRVPLLSSIERHESGGASAGAEPFLCTWARLCAKKMSARQHEFAFPAREGVFIIQIPDGDARGKATLRALARGKFRVRTQNYMVLY